MIKINKFYWQLYKGSPEGQKAIEIFKRAFAKDISIKEQVQLMQQFDTVYFENTDIDSMCSRFYIIQDKLKHFLHKYSFLSKEQCRESAIALLDEVERKYPTSDKSYRDLMSNIVPISMLLAPINPEYFVPYLFLIRYRYLHQIIMDYDLSVNEVNGKYSHRERLHYYLDLCDAFFEFRKLNNLSPAELCAFMYDMERKSYDSDEQTGYTKYPRVWLLVGGKNPMEVDANTMFWQGNQEMKKGDICVFYENSYTCSGNPACLTGIWVAESDGHIDPFFHFYESVRIGQEHKCKPMPFSILFKDKRTQTLPHLGAHLCGACGSELSSDLYENGLLPLIKEWDPKFEDKTLPQIYHSDLPQDDIANRGDMKPEKWVEEYRIKPLLQNMGFIKGRDYLQQVYLQMGRDKEEGERVQAGKTDFSVFPFGNKIKGEPKCADVLIEAKAPGEMSTDKEIQKTFWQAESYASRQYANLLIITDGNQFLVYPRKKYGIFQYSDPNSKIEKYSWEDLSSTNTEAFKKFRETILTHKQH